MANKERGRHRERREGREDRHERYGQRNKSERERASARERARDIYSGKSRDQESNRRGGERFFGTSRHSTANLAMGVLADVESRGGALAAAVIPIPTSKRARWAWWRLKPSMLPRHEENNAHARNINSISMQRTC